MLFKRQPLYITCSSKFRQTSARHSWYDTYSDGHHWPKVETSSNPYPPSRMLPFQFHSMARNCEQRGLTQKSCMTLIPGPLPPTMANYPKRGRSIPSLGSDYLAFRIRAKARSPQLHFVPSSTFHNLHQHLHRGVSYGIRNRYRQCPLSQVSNGSFNPIFQFLSSIILHRFVDIRTLAFCKARSS
jgi:hypothetical protein